MTMRTCVSPQGTFRYGIHKPSYSVRNLRRKTRIQVLGLDQSGDPVLNEANFPPGEVDVSKADRIFEIANPFPFRGTTFIGKEWADRNAAKGACIKLPSPPPVSLSKILLSRNIDASLIVSLPRPLLLSLATCSTDPDDLIALAHHCCKLEQCGKNGLGLHYVSNQRGDVHPDISDEELFEAVANNPALPDTYKIAMVIRPGAQGASEIVGDYRVHDAESTSSVYEYLRRNSYIAGGHYAANMSDDSIRYRIDSLSLTDMKGLRHLYYQRTFIRIADYLGIAIPAAPLSEADLETLRAAILKHDRLHTVPWDATLWGWNFGFDFASSGYRLHASHQQVHQQYSLIAKAVAADTFDPDKSLHDFKPFSAGDMIGETIECYRTEFNSDFFTDYLRAIKTNRRMDGRNDRDDSLIVWQDEHVVLFVPKAQISQWELQVMTKPGVNTSWPGNILEADLVTRRSLDRALLKAQQALAGRGAQMVTTIEFSKRFSSPETSQPLLYSLLPKIPQSPGAFSEAQLRFINGHYPEDFATACRESLQSRQP